MFPLNRGFPISPLCQSHLLLVFFLMITILTCVSWYLIVVCICTSLVISDVEDLFMSLLVICISFLGKISVQVFCPVFNQVFFFWCWVVWVTYICWIWPQLVISFTNILSLISSHLFIFDFISFVLGDRFKTILLHTCQRVLPTFSSRSFMVSSLIFVSLIHLELICVCSIRKCPNFIFSHVAVWFLQHQLLKRFFSPPFNILASFVIE